MLNSTSKLVTNGSFLLEFHNYEIQWLISLTFNVVIIFFALYLTFSTANRTCGCFKKNLNVCQKRLLQMATLASALTLPRLISTNFLFWIGFNNRTDDQTCEVLLDISVVAYVLVFVMVYLFLWWRQRHIYKQPSMVSINTKAFRILSWVCFFCLIASGIAIAFMFVFSIAHKSTPAGCFPRDYDSEDLLTSFSLFYVAIAVMVSSQITLFALLAHPLISHLKLHSKQKNSQQKKISSNLNKSQFFLENNAMQAATTTATITDKNLQTTTTEEKLPKTIKSQFSFQFCSTKQRLLRLIKRNAACALGCITSDLTALIINGMIIKATQPRYFTQTILDISMILNVVFFLLSFDNCRELFCCFCSST